LAVEVANSGKYAVLPRTSTIESVMTLHKIERSALTEQDNIKKIGAALNSRYVLAGNVRSLGRNNMFTAEILNIETAGQVTGGGENYQAIGDGLKVMASLGVKLTGAAPANMVRVEGGTFLMGSANVDSDWDMVHEVTLKSFYIGKYEVTQKEWVEVMGNNPSHFKGDDLPVENVDWYEAVEFCNKLSVKEGLAPAYRGSGDNIVCDFSASGYRLPTEAEWEYAAKGGNRDAIYYEYSGSNSVDSVAWHGGWYIDVDSGRRNGRNSDDRTHPVGTKQPNSLGIYDMSGNVWEWCWDWLKSYGSGSAPLGTVHSRVLRGGSWNDSATEARSANRASFPPYYGSYYAGSSSYLISDHGFRVARSASP
jgi:formylglycine-generating enzyme required for sulfatase activity